MTNSDRGIASRWDTFTKGAVNHLPHVSFCQEMQEVSLRSLLKFSHGKSVLAIQIMHDLENPKCYYAILKNCIKW